MSTAKVQLNRMVSLVAELTRRRDEEGSAMSLEQLGQLLDATPREIQADLRRLTYLHESSDTDWLLSLQILVEGDTVEGGSGGPFRRPMRLTPEELLVLRLSLGLDEDADPRGSPVAELLGDEPMGGFAPFEHADASRTIVDLLLRAETEQRRVEMDYAGLGETEFSARTVHPYQIVNHGGGTYLIAWCETRSDWRRFRVDRILEVRETGESFTARDDCPYDQIFVGQGDTLDEVQVRFSPRVARWLKERYPSATTHHDGAVTVTYQVASPDWLVERVLQYGADAEVVGPAFYRAAVRRAVS